MPDTEDVLAVRDDAVLLLTLNRPSRLNAWTPPMTERYARLLTAADRDEGIRAVVVTGSGRAFCSGSDIAAAPDGDHDTDCSALTMPIRMRTPVIAAINGTVAGSGLLAALFTDIRFVTPDARITTTVGRSGLADEHGMTWLLPKLVGIGAAMDLLLSARTLRGEQARELGLVDRVVTDGDVTDAALSYAHALVGQCSAATAAEIKSHVYTGLDSGLQVAARDPRARLGTALWSTEGPGTPPAEN